jgi:hypothetical protein
MDCEQKARLAKEYHLVAEKFAEAVSKLLGHVGSAMSEEFERLRLGSEVARAECDAARLSLEEHVAAHGC